MKTSIFIIGFLAFWGLSLVGQTSFNFSDNYSASCDGPEILVQSQTSIFIQDDSIIIEDLITNQCCPQFVLNILEIENDSLYVLFKDTTTTMMCDCICDFSVRINAGKTSMGPLNINYNGVWHTILNDEYSPFIEPEKKWTTVITDVLNDEPPILTERSLSQENTSIVENTRRYYPIAGAEDYYYEEEKGKVYYHEEERQYLIYDFTLNPNDSVKVGDPNEQAIALFVDSVKYIKYMDEKLRKTIFLSGDMNLTWLEGIGDLNSPFDYWCPIPPCGLIPHFACCSLLDVLLYQNPQYPNCGEFTAITSNANSELKIFPNPTNGFIEIQGLENGNLNYSIVNLIGKVEQKGKLESHISLDLNKGIYILIIEDGMRSIYVEKLIVQ